MLLRRSSLAVDDEGGREGGSIAWGVSTTTETVRVGPKAVHCLWMRFQELW